MTEAKTMRELHKEWGEVGQQGIWGFFVQYATPQSGLILIICLIEVIQLCLIHYYMYIARAVKILILCQDCRGTIVETRFAGNQCKL
jgi:hypothetical protein